MRHQIFVTRMYDYSYFSKKKKTIHIICLPLFQPVTNSLWINNRVKPIGKLNNLIYPLHFLPLFWVINDCCCPVCLMQFLYLRVRYVFFLSISNRSYYAVSHVIFHFVVIFAMDFHVKFTAMITTRTSITAVKKQ